MTKGNARRSSPAGRRPPAPAEPPAAKTRTTPRQPAIRSAPPTPARRREDGEPLMPSRGGLSGIIRGAGSVFGQVSGMDGPARALERLAASAERGAEFLERLDTEVGLDRAARLLDRLDHLTELVEEMHASLRRIEDRLGDPDRRGYSRRR